MLTDYIGQCVGRLPTTAPLFAASITGLLSLRRVDTVKPDAGVADPDGIAVNDFGDAGEGLLFILLFGRYFRPPMTMIVAGHAIVMAAFFIEAPAVGEYWPRQEQENKNMDQPNHHATIHATGEISMRLSLLAILLIIPLTGCQTIAAKLLNIKPR